MTWTAKKKATSGAKHRHQSYMVLGNISLPFVAMGFRNCPPPAWSFCMANAQLPCFDTWLTAEMAQLCSVKLGVCPAQRAREKKYKDHRQAPEMLEAAARLQAAAAEHKGTTSGVKRDVCMSCTNSTASAQWCKRLQAAKTVPKLIWSASSKPCCCPLSRRSLSSSSIVAQASTLQRRRLALTALLTLVAGRLQVLASDNQPKAMSHRPTVRHTSTAATCGAVDSSRSLWAEHSSSKALCHCCRCPKRRIAKDKISGVIREVRWAKRINCPSSWIWGWLKNGAQQKNDA